MFVFLKIQLEIRRPWHQNVQRWEQISQKWKQMFSFFWLQFPSVSLQRMDWCETWKQEGHSAGRGVQSWFSSYRGWSQGSR